MTRRQSKHLPPVLKRLVRGAVDSLCADPYLGRELVGDLTGYRSFRVRRYRVIYRVNEDESFLAVYHFGHRRDVYEMLKSLLGEPG
jgi:mRNA interferase RelE/StbE